MKRLIVVALALILLVLPFGVSAQEATDEPVVTNAQAVLDLLLNGDYAGVFEQFSDEVKAAFSADQLEGAWAQILAQVGEYQSVLGTRFEAETNTGVLQLQFELYQLDLRLTFDAAGKISGLYFVQGTYAPPDQPTWSAPPYADEAAFTETELTINEGGDFPLSATLSLPNGDGPFPAIILLSGSGTNDEDETVGPNKTFRDLAWGLATQGVAVLRFPKRPTIYANDLDLATFTIDQEYTEDALAALDLLRNTEGVDPEQIFIAGHSLGGYILPRIGTQASGVAGLIYLAPLARSLQDALRDQYAYLLSLSGASDIVTLSILDNLANVINTLTEEDADDPTMLFGSRPIYYLDLQGYDPVATAAELTVPMLFIQGERDYQVTVADDLALWQAGLGDRADVAFETFPTLNHLLMPGDGTPSPEEYQTPGHVDGGVINAIAEWVNGE